MISRDLRMMTQAQQLGALFLQPLLQGGTCRAGWAQRGEGWLVDFSLHTLLISRVDGPLSSLCTFPPSESSVPRDPTSFCPRRHSATRAAPEHKGLELTAHHRTPVSVRQKLSSLFWLAWELRHQSQYCSLEKHFPNFKKPAFKETSGT